MKKKFMKKAVAATLSAAVVLSMLPLSGLTDVSAKAPFVKLNTTFKTLTVGQTYKLKLNNNTLGWKVTKAVSKDSTVCKAANKKSYVKLTAEGEGRTTVRVTLKTAKRKGNSAVKKLSCRVNIKPVEMLPDTPEVPDLPVLPDTPKVETDKTVESQEALEKALADENVKKITIKTDSEKTFTIASGEYKDVDVIVDAPKADVDNSGVFKSITIKAIKDSTWFEKAIGNAIRVEALKTRIVVAQSAVVSDISLVTPGADVGIEVRGVVKDIQIKSKLSAVISGSATEKIPVTVDAAAVNAALTFSIPVKVTTAANISVIFQKGAQDSTLDLTEKTISVEVETSVKIEVQKADGTKQTIITYFDKRVISLANLPISQDLDIQSVEIKAKSGKELTDRAFDAYESLKYEGIITEVAEAKIISAEYSKSGKTISIQTSGTDADLSQLYGCDLVLKVNGTEYELRGKFQQEWKDGQPSGNYTSDGSVLKHLDIPENAEIYLVYNTKLTDDQFGDGRNRGVLTDMAGKPLLATMGDIKVTIID